MNIVYETLISHLPAKRKTTPSGWLSFNAPCCVHNGTGADTRQRGGIINNESDGTSYHCFNCGYKASWKPGRRVTYKMKRLMQWLNIPDDTITKVSLAVLETENIRSTEIVTLPKFTSKDLPEGAKPLREWADYCALESTGVDENLMKVFGYLKERQLYFDDYDFHWTPLNGYKDRLIVPFYNNKKIVGYTARKVKDGNPKYISDQQPGYVFNIDAQKDRVYTIVVEGPFDAIAVEGVALLGNEIKDQQSLMINSLNTKVIVVPDRDEAGQNILNQAIDLGWGVSMPPWDEDVKDVNEAVQRYGKLYTLHTIIGYAEFNELKIKLGAKKWFG
tara:strand:+ start:2013 stop:3008 length:996 start_codon:yes stop_codon:yes gene_type:complete